MTNSFLRRMQEYKPSAEEEKHLQEMRQAAAEAKASAKADPAPRHTVKATVAPAYSYVGRCRSCHKRAAVLDDGYCMDCV